MLEASLKLFLAWSGGVSQRAAEAFHSWIPNVLQTIEPFMSDEDIAIGSRWSRQLDQELEESHFGVIFVTPENFDKPWLLFEAGALSKSIADSKVSPLLIGLTPARLTGPLTHFQSASPRRSDVKRMVASINEACGESRLDDERLDKVFTTWWGELEPQLAELVGEAEKHAGPADQDRRSDSDVLAETLEVVRSLQRAVSDPMTLLPPDYLEFAMSNLRSWETIPVEVVRDLDVGLQRLEELLENSGQRDIGWLEALTDGVRQLRMPVEYFRDELRGRRPRRPRRVDNY